MSQKPDFYEVLGIERSATEADIKKAFQRIVMTCHPDVLKTKKLSDEDRAKAEEKFKYGKDAQAVLLDPVKRTAYDKFGHAGVESMANGQKPQQSWSDAMGPVKKRVRTQDEVFDYFSKVTVDDGKPAPVVDTGPDVSEEDMRRAAAEARRRNRGQSGDMGREAYIPPVQTDTPKPAAKPAPAPAPAAKPATRPASAANTGAAFEDVAGKVSEAASRLQQAASAEVSVPVAVLEKFRDNLQDFIGEIDTAIQKSGRRTPKNGHTP